MLGSYFGQGYLGQGYPAQIGIPTTSYFTSSQVSGGLCGAVSTTKNAARVYGIASITSWSGIIGGSEAKLTASSDWGANAQLIYVSVDGGAYVECARSSGVYTLFTGLADTLHTVVWRFGSAYATVPYIAASGNVLEVTGVNPSLYTFSNWAQLRDGGTKHAWSAATVASTAAYDPPYLADPDSAAAGSNVASIRIRGTFTKLAISSFSNYVFVSIDGGMATRYAMPGGADNNATRGLIISGLSGDHYYNVWNSGAPANIKNPLAVSGDGVLVDIGIKRRLDQFGDSITAGPGATCSGNVETMQVAAALGFTGSTSGVSGILVGPLDTLLTTLLPKRVVTSDDIAIWCPGRNNTGGPFDAPTTAAYQSGIAKLLAKGYGMVLCRGLLPEGANTWPAENGSIASIVAGLANPNVKFIDTSSWTGIETADGTHPTDGGYISLKGRATPTYSAAFTPPSLITETASAADYTDAVYISSASASESASGTDNISGTYGSSSWSVSLTDNASATDSPSSTGILVSTISDTSIATESESAAAILVNSISDTTSAIDTQSATSVLVSQASDTASASDTVTSGSIMTGAAIESASGTDSTSSIATLASAISEAVSATSTQSDQYIGNASISETVTAQETSTVGSSVLSSSISELVSGSDVQSSQSVAVASQQDTGAAIEQSSAQDIAVASQSELCSATDFVLGQIIYFSSIYEITSATDSSSCTGQVIQALLSIKLNSFIAREINLRSEINQSIKLDSSIHAEEI